MEKSRQRITPFFTFSGNAEEAMNYYISIFPDSKLVSLTRISKEDRGEEGKLLNGTFELMGQQFMVLDMEKEYCPAFTWAVSSLIECKDQKEFDHLFTNLSEEGVVMMGPEPILHFRQVAWVTDKFGVTWQLIWE
ncbi:VOC family protein [Niallia sp. 01092]|uniref:VOC family protein n=1 Tax=unclassified Niallia TaxID=2837522 RepID=UPI003FCF2F7E